MATEPSATEQLMMEYVNRARSDPLGELDRLITSRDPVTGAEASITSALRFFNVDVNVLYSQLNGVAAVAPLAWDLSLGTSARTHSQLMISFDDQSHNLPGEPSLRDRIELAGYSDWRTIAENIYAFSQSPLHGHAGFYIDWGFGPDGIQDPAGHRDAILNPTYSDIGISALAETDGSTSVGPLVVTQHFGAQFGSDAKLTGVVIDDADNDDFYDIGEGLGGVTVSAVGSAGSFSTLTFASGGYTLEVPDGAYTVTFTGGGLGGTVMTDVVVAGQNIKLDAEVDDVSTPLPDTPPPSDPRIVVIDGPSLDRMVGTVDAETFVLANDGIRDVIKGFEIGVDVLDVSALGAVDLDDLVIKDLVKRSGVVNWIQISDPTGEAEVILRTTDTSTMQASLFTSDSFVFAEPGASLPVPTNLISDGPGRDDLRGTTASDTFVMIDDDTRDLVRGFEIGNDKIDVAAMGISTFDEISLRNLYRSDGSVSWVQAEDAGGGAEFLIRFSSGTELNANALTQDDFLFS